MSIQRLTSQKSLLLTFLDEVMRFISIFLLLSGVASADEFDWERPDATISKIAFLTPSGPIQVVAGSLCGISIYCEISVKYINLNDEELEIINEMTSSIVTLALVNDEIEISSSIYLYGSEEGERITYRYGWSENDKKLEFKTKRSQKIRE